MPELCALYGAACCLLLSAYSHCRAAWLILLILLYIQVILAILRKAGYSRKHMPQEASLILLNTCAIRDRAEQKIWSRLGVLRQVHSQKQPAAHMPVRRHKPLIGVLGCMAERLKGQLLERSTGVDLVAGPDAYRDIPRLLALLQVHHANVSARPVLSLTPSHRYTQALSVLRKCSIWRVMPVPKGCCPCQSVHARKINFLCLVCAHPAQLPGQVTCLLLQEQAEEEAAPGVMNVQLSAEETYADITPVRAAGAKSAYVSVMRGCNNMCAFCIVPHTRGRERSRPLASILSEVGC